jgi:hypothetical protein
MHIPPYIRWVFLSACLYLYTSCDGSRNESRGSRTKVGTNWIQESKRRKEKKEYLTVGLPLGVEAAAMDPCSAVNGNCREERGGGGGDGWEPTTTTRELL